MSINRQNMILLESFSIPAGGIIAALIIHLFLGYTDLVTIIKVVLSGGSIIAGFFTFL